MFFSSTFLKKKKAATTTKSTKQNYSLSRGEKGENEKKSFFPFRFLFFVRFAARDFLTRRFLQSATLSTRHETPLCLTKRKKKKR